MSHQPNGFEATLKPLWDLAQHGDEAAYREALRAIADRIRSYARNHLKHAPHEVEDLVQETLLAIHTRRGTYDPAFPVSAWVYAVARHKLIDFLRRSGRRDALNDPLDAVDESQLVTGNTDGAVNMDLDALLSELPDAQRDAIVLTKLEGLSMLEASERTGISVSALKVQVHRGLKKLATLVKR